MSLTHIWRELDIRIPGWDSIWRLCSSLFRHWPPPPRWSAQAWSDEVRDEAVAAALQAHAEFDAGRGPTIACFIYGRVRRAVLQRYRREWAYGGRCLEDEAEEVVARAESDLMLWLLAVEANVRALPARHGDIIQLLFYEDRTEAEVGGMWQMTHQAVSKRKREALKALRRMLEKS